MQHVRWSITSLGSERSDQRDSDRKSTRLNSSHDQISYAVFCLKKKKKIQKINRYSKNNHENAKQEREQYYDCYSRTDESKLRGGTIAQAALTIVVGSVRTDVER